MLMKVVEILLFIEFCPILIDFQKKFHWWIYEVSSVGRLFFGIFESYKPAAISKL
jgi:hypothetical protein